MPIEKTQQWIINFVLHHNLCPFAHHPHQQGRIRYQLSTAENIDDIIQEFLEELDLLERNETQTTLIIYAAQFTLFSEYLDLVAILEEVLNDQKREDTYQLASFHPQYLFADSDYDDPANATNRSPFPMIHLLRWNDVYQAINNHPDTLGIPERNIALLRSLHP